MEKKVSFINCKMDSFENCEHLLLLKPKHYAHKQIANNVIKNIKEQKTNP